MEKLTQYLNKAQQFNNLILKAKKVSNQIRHGSQKSIYKGNGILFEEVRKYQHGDDVRTINWGVTAKLRETYVKTYNKEKGQIVWLLIDGSRSGIFGTRARTKIETIVELSAVLAHISLKNNCAVGALLFSNKLELVHQPSTTFSSFYKFLHSLLAITPISSQTDLVPAIDYLLNQSRPGALIFLISDFISSRYQEKVKVLSQKHDLIGIRVYDKTEVNFPATEFIHLVDVESQERIFVNTTSKFFRTSYNTWLAKHLTYFQNTFSAIDKQTLQVATDDDYVEKLKKALNNI